MGHSTKVTPLLLLFLPEPQLAGVKHCYSYGAQGRILFFSVLNLIGGGAVLSPQNKSTSRNEPAGGSRSSRFVSAPQATRIVAGALHAPAPSGPERICAAAKLGSTKTHRCHELPVDHTVGGHIVVAFVSPNCPSRSRPHDPIDGSMVVASASKSTLHLYNSGRTAVSVIIVPVVTVTVRVIPIIGIGIRIEERETKRVDKDERSIVETIVETVEAIVEEPMRAGHGPWRKPRCWPRHPGTRHCGMRYHW